MTYPLAVFKFLLSIPTWFMTVTSSFVLKYILRAPVEQVNDPLTRLDLEHFIDTSLNNEDDEIETELFKNALNLKDIRVRDCMIPRNEIMFIEMSDSIAELKEAFVEAKHSRLLVAEGGIENIIGYVHHLQLIKSPKSIKSIMMEIDFVPEAMNVQDLLYKFVKGNINMACVVDEFGGTEGIITLEDILEEIFGEIEDEHDKEDLLEFEISPYEFIFSGRVELDYINEKYENLDIPSGEYHTLSGYIVMTAGNIPEQGDEIELNNVLFTIEKVGETKIETIRVEIPHDEQESDS
jgi:CBS domain containing-hemolysin-like protein